MTMGYSARILADSLAPCGKRLTTFEITYPRMIHSELMTHRMLSRNSASSRAIPTAKMIEQVLRDPVLPIWWGKNQSGMQAKEELTGQELEWTKQEWLAARDKAVEEAIALNRLGLHKQIANRLLEPWMWITVIVSATEWDNFFHLRCHPDAQPEIQKIAYMMHGLYLANKPVDVPIDMWHLPLIRQEDYEELYVGKISMANLVRVSVGRCARVSYLTHDGKRDLIADIELCSRLSSSGHWSPFEHVAQAVGETDVRLRYGNFIGWKQYRKTFEDEHYGGRMP
jgi:thymidylate synthase ThyX